MPHGELHIYAKIDSLEILERNDLFMQAYTLKEVSKKINVPPAMIRQWEKELSEFLIIPRSKQGARIFTENEINKLKEIKKLYEQKLTKDSIRLNLVNVTSPVDNQVQPENEIETKPDFGLNDCNPDDILTNNEDTSYIPETALEVISEPTVPMIDKSEDQAKLFFEVMETYKRNLLNEVKEEISQVIRKEFVAEVKKEIKNANLTTVKSLSDSIYKSTENTKYEIQELTESVEKVSEVTTSKLTHLTNRVKNISKETSLEVSALSKRLSETSQEISHYADMTYNEISALSDTISMERELFAEEQDQFRQDIRQREAAFQEMLSSFRDAAAAKEKKWWKFWA